MSECEFQGVSAERGRGVRRLNGLYEFWTDRGERIYLHDTDFRGLRYEPSAPTLTMEFEYDPAWTPPDLVDRPVIVLRFSGVQVHSWEEESRPVPSTDADRDHAGQVSIFDWDGRRSFELQTLWLTLRLSCDQVTVSTRGRA